MSRPISHLTANELSSPIPRSSGSHGGDGYGGCEDISAAAFRWRTTTGELRLRLLLLPWCFIFLTSVSYSSSRCSDSSLSSPSTRTLVLYSKPGRFTCDELKEKLQSAFLISGPNSLHDVVLPVRDITIDPEWEKAYQYEIPVLAKLRPDGTEVMIRLIARRDGSLLLQ